ELRVEPERFAGGKADEGAAVSPQPVARAPMATEAATPRRVNPSLRHDLDAFVVGPSNQLAYAATRRLADETAEEGHPLFLHGGCGLGKTHLLQGACNAVLRRRPDARVLYTTGEQFTNDYIAAVRANKI